LNAVQTQALLEYLTALTDEVFAIEEALKNTDAGKALARRNRGPVTVHGKFKRALQNLGEELLSDDEEE
jgi:hypothetical protein